MVQRLTLRRRNPWNTKSNKTYIVKTPGGKNVFLYRKKQVSLPKCGDTGVELRGIKAVRPNKRSKTRHSKLTVTRAYGGCLSHSAVRERIVRAFLIEEQKIANKILKQKDTK